MDITLDTVGKIVLILTMIVQIAYTVLTSSRKPHFLPISFPQILPDKIRHFS